MYYHRLRECKKVCPCTKTSPQSGIRAWIKQGCRKRKKRDREDRGQEADGKKTNKTKTYLGNLNNAYLSQLRLTKLGEERLSSLSHRMWSPAPLLPHIVGGLFREYRRYIIFLEPDFGPLFSFSLAGIVGRVLTR